MNGIPEYGTGRHEDYLCQQEERAEVARDQRAEETKREFDGWFEAQGLDDQGRFDQDEMQFAFESGMQAERDLDAKQEPKPAPELADGGEALGEIYWDAYRGEPRRPGWSVPHGPFSKMSDAHREAVEIGARAVAAHVTGTQMRSSAALARNTLRVGNITGGGESPDDCAGLLEYDDEAESEEHLQWIAGAGVASRPVFRGPWTVTHPARPELAPGEDPDDNLTAAEREDSDLAWRAEKGLRAR